MVRLRIHSRAILAAVFLALAGQGLLLYLAAEHHHSGPAPHDCAVCVAITTFGVDVQPTPAVAPLSALGILDLAGDQRPPILTERASASSRGPPPAV